MQRFMIEFYSYGIRKAKSFKISDMLITTNEKIKDQMKNSLGKISIKAVSISKKAIYFE